MNINEDCFVCRLFRAFAFSGLGAGLVGSGALLLGAGPSDAMLWAFVGAVAGVFYMQKRQPGR
ncbi:MAG: hypothetical protein GY731_13305 [Gammaproteobacteria bacterium]|nr:hypothetical protein [Gammaproteobacteria bacterium]